MPEWMKPGAIATDGNGAQGTIESIFVYLETRLPVVCLQGDYYAPEALREVRYA